MKHIRHDGKIPVESCYHCLHLDKSSICTLMKDEIKDVFAVPLWCPLPSVDENYNKVSDKSRAIEAQRLMGVLRATIDRRCAPDQVLIDALTAVECEISILISSLDKKEKL